MGLGTESARSWFTSLIPFNLILTFLGTFLWADVKMRRVWIPMLFCFILGIGIEVIGVATNWPFGDYSYTSLLGLSILKVPILIGLNWVMLSYGAWIWLKSIIKSKVLHTLGTGVLLALFDIPLEHFAGEFGLWTWRDGFAPLENYVSWGVIGAIMGLIWTLFNSSAPANKLAVFLFWLQAVFLLSLCLF